MYASPDPRRTVGTPRRGVLSPFEGRIAFKPGVVCGGQLSPAEAARRAKRCTRLSLEQLKASDEFLRWETARNYRQRVCACLRWALLACAVSASLLAGAALLALAALHLQAPPDLLPEEGGALAAAAARGPSDSALPVCPSGRAPDPPGLSLPLPAPSSTAEECRCDPPPPVCPPAGDGGASARREAERCARELGACRGELQASRAAAANCTERLARLQPEMDASAAAVAAAAREAAAAKEDADAAHTEASRCMMRSRGLESRLQAAEAAAELRGSELAGAEARLSEIGEGLAQLEAALGEGACADRSLAGAVGSLREKADGGRPAPAGDAWLAAFKSLCCAEAVLLLVAAVAAALLRRRNRTLRAEVLRLRCDLEDQEIHLRGTRHARSPPTSVAMDTSPPNAVYGQRQFLMH